MHSSDTVIRSFELAEAGHTQAEIATALGIGRSTIGRWLSQGREATLTSTMRSRAASGCPDACRLVHTAPVDAYAYLLGQYLGDGTIVATRRDVYRLFVTCCAAYPGIVEECCRAIAAVLPDNRIGQRAKPGAIDVNCYSKHLPCLFPQHGAGRKHTRTIELAPWQRRIALDLRPDQFVRGLIHSDGCRSLNRVRNGSGKEYAYVRYQFSNRSEDIHRLFTEACDRLGVQVRRMNAVTLSVARRDSVAILERVVGPKS